MRLNCFLGEPFFFESSLRIAGMGVSRSDTYGLLYLFGLDTLRI